MFGKALIFMGFGLALITTVLYFLSNKNSKLTPIARSSYFVLSGIAFLAAGFLMMNILEHNFQYSYIWQYSGKNLSTFLTITTFWAGQQGSFMLWMTMLVLFGLIVIPYAKKNNYESLAMGFHSLILLFIFVLLISKNPFEFLWETYADQNVEVGFVPEDGRGLNPILQNYWNVIHPPILFLGFSSMVIPFTFALAGLFKREYQRWINIAIPWTLLATAMLGTGIMLGGFWAYETLGWGGFWAWDPVENSSLLPWLVAIALVHTMLVQKRTGGLVKTNFLLAAVGFVLVLYSTFLTRSGILGDTSVHSFGEPGQSVYVLLLIFLITFALISVVTLLLRMPEINNKAPKPDFNPSSKEFHLSVGSLVILAVATIVFIGTSWPIAAEFLGQPKVAIEPPTYDKLTFPLAIIILIMNAFALLLGWKKSEMKQVIIKAGMFLGISLLLTAILYFVGVQHFDFMLLGFAAIFSLLVNAYFIFKYVVKRPSNTGAFISHTGLALLLLGVIASGGYEKTQHLQLKQNETKSVFGYDFTYVKKDRIEKQYMDREKYQYNIKVEKGSREVILNPIMYWSDYNDREYPYMVPGIKTLVDRDIYLSPKSMDFEFNFPTEILGKGEAVPVPMDSSYKIRMVQFDMSHAMTPDQSNNILFGVVTEFIKDDKVYTDTLNARMNSQTGEMDPIWVQIPDTEIDACFYQLIRGQMMSDSRSAYAFKETGTQLQEPQEVFTFEVTMKPMMYLVWIGTVFTMIGFVIAINKHIKQRNQVKINNGGQSFDNNDNSPDKIALVRNGNGESTENEHKQEEK
ncbi:MAG: heme lyase CcmF/NrfE family subunit [Bacteroidota bacterium]